MDLRQCAPAPDLQTVARFSLRTAPRTTAMEKTGPAHDVTHHPGSDDDNSPEPSAGQKRKRVRASRACETCRSRKVKCNEQNPCSNCVSMLFIESLC
jgi:Fungal Zn(2)-Cys(6) binuclear cluster domain